MKRLALTILVVAAVLPTRAQLFSPESFSGAAFGAMMGSIIGGDCHGPSGKGAAIGAGVGLVAGALAGEANRRNRYYSEPVSYVPAPSVSLGYGYSGGGSSAYVYYSPNYYTAPGYYYRPAAVQTYPQPAARPNYAVNTTLLGAASGALIGSANHNAGKGATIGAASGLVLGGIAEHQTRKQERRAAAAQTTTQAQQPASDTTMETVAPQQQVSRSEITSRPVATSTYTWTSRPQQLQIADAPRVPDAPTF